MRTLTPLVALIAKPAKSYKMQLMGWADNLISGRIQCKIQLMNLAMSVLHLQRKFWKPSSQISIVHWARQVAKVPAWVFHGTKDDLEPFERTREFVGVLKKLGAEVKFTPLPDRDHFILDTYENREIYDWLLQHKRKQ